VAAGAVGFGVEQQNLIWAMWRRGDSIREMERTLGETAPRIRRFLRQSGGIRPLPRRRRADQVRAPEREEISRGIAAGLSARSIAALIDRSPSTVSREIARNGGRLAYRAVVADAAAFERARRPKPSKLATNPLLRGVVVAKLVEDWSPQQIAQWLRRDHPADVSMRVSHESIYRDLYMPSRNAFDRSVFHRLRGQRPIRRPRLKASSHGRGRIRNMVSIHARPVEADTRAVAGHWEGDLVFGTRPSAVATLVDRATRYTIVVALPGGYKADAVARALIEQMGQLPAHQRQSLTWDRGREMAEHARITAALATPVFFCDPHHPWQRGTNENTNRLLRQYLHKNSDLSVFSQQDLDTLAAKLNHRPRRVLDWASPAEVFSCTEMPRGRRRTPLASGEGACPRLGGLTGGHR
jgi:IS30 family transposase